MKIEATPKEIAELIREMQWKKPSVAVGPAKKPEVAPDKPWTVKVAEPVLVYCSAEIEQTADAIRMTVAENQI